MAGLSDGRAQAGGVQPRAVLTGYLLWVTRRESDPLPPKMALNKPGAAVSAGGQVGSAPPQTPPCSAIISQGWESPCAVG